MLNLAGRGNCDEVIRRELTRARIPVVEVARVNREVAYSVMGKLGNLEFTRAWSYWVVSGPVPLNVALELYADPVGVTDIRVAGHAGCPSPADWSRTTASGRFVETYHIDTEVGLRIFVDTIRAHNLDSKAAA